MTELAQALAAYLTARGYPLLAVEVDDRPPYPLVTLWDDSIEMTRVIACITDPARYDDAFQFAETMAVAMEVSGSAPGGAVPLVCCIEQGRAVLFETR